MKLQKFVIDDTWFKHIFYLYIGDWGITKKYLENKWKNLKLPDDKETNGKYFGIEKDNRLVRIIWLKEFDWSIYWQSQLIHEIFHYVFASLKDKGLKPSDDSEEAYSYYMENIFFNVYQKLKYLNPKYRNYGKRK